MIPSLSAGVLLGFNNFFLSLISELGLKSAFIFSLGAIGLSLSYQCIMMLKVKNDTGRYWSVQHSNLMHLGNNQRLQVKWINVLGLILRTIVNFLFQGSIILGFKYAGLAGINQGIITALLCTYCVFTSVIFYFLFQEQLRRKFIVGIAFMLLCVILVSYPENDKIDIDAPTTQQEPLPDNVIKAIGFGLLAPLLISVFISISRYWTVNYGYNSQDLTMDTVLLLGIVEIGFFSHYY